eukprot:1982216-Amphidinium_carterae.1
MGLCLAASDGVGRAVSALRGFGSARQWQGIGDCWNRTVHHHIGKCMCLSLARRTQRNAMAARHHSPLIPRSPALLTLLVHFHGKLCLQQRATNSSQMGCSGEQTGWASGRATVRKESALVTLLWSRFAHHALVIPQFTNVPSYVVLVDSMAWVVEQVSACTNAPPVQVL